MKPSRLSPGEQALVAFLALAVAVALLAAFGGGK